MCEPPPPRQVTSGDVRYMPHGGVRPVHQNLTCLTRLTLGPYVVQIWSRNPLDLRADETLALHRVVRFYFFGGVSGPGETPGRGTDEELPLTGSRTLIYYHETERRVLKFPLGLPPCDGPEVEEGHGTGGACVVPRIS